KCFPSLSGSKSPGQSRSLSRVLSSSRKSPNRVFRDAASLRLELLEMLKDQSLGCQGHFAILSTIKKLESDENLAKGPPLDSVKLAKLEVRILRLNKIKESTSREVACHEKDLHKGSTGEGANTVVDNKIAAKKEGLSTREGVDEEEKIDAGAVKADAPEEIQESQAESEGESGEENSESESRENGAK
ncbi:hypothetical protein U1Q18_037606, partial [Sarracenia purpurea var. burkii]